MINLFYFSSIIHDSDSDSDSGDLFGVELLQVISTQWEKNMKVNSNQNQLKVWLDLFLRSSDVISLCINQHLFVTAK